MAKHSFLLVLTIGILGIVLACMYRFDPFHFVGTRSTYTSATLSKAINIADLSTAEFKYRGIAEVYTNEKKTKVKCRVCYNASVAASIDLKRVAFDVDNDNRIITASLPPIDIEVTVDENSMATLPSNANVGIDVMYNCSKEDVENEAKASDDLLNTARNNSKSFIEGLLYTSLKKQNYTLKWK